MTPTARLFVSLGAVAMALAVALGAFGAHALRERLAAADLAIWNTAVQYHIAHALGLFAVALVAHWLPDSGAVRWSGWLMLLGLGLFCGSLYILVLSGQRWLGAVTPLGGTAWIVAWVLLAIGAWRG